MSEDFDFECKPKNNFSLQTVDKVTSTSKIHGFLWIKK